MRKWVILMKNIKSGKRNFYDNKFIFFIRIGFDKL